MGSHPSAAASGPTNFFKCQWVPSHLNDPGHKNAAKRQRYIDDGTTTEEHINGNSHADALAGKGVLLHDVDGDALYDDRVRQKLARIAQNMMLTIWRAHRAEVNPGSSADDYSDIAAVADGYGAGTQFYDDYDYNPFEEEASVSASTSPATATRTADVPRSHASRFPAYPWDNGQQLEDEGLTIL